MWNSTRLLSTDRTRHPAQRERVLASGRVFLATACLIAIYLDPTEPERFAPLTYGLLSMYAVYGVGVLLMLRSGRPGWPPVVLHSLDVLWATALTYFTSGPNSPFYLFFMFALLAAAFRWGFRETILTATAIFTIVVGEGLVMGWARFTADPAFAVNRMIFRSAYLLIMTLLLGYLAEQEKRWHGELQAIATITKHPTVSAGMHGTLRAVGAEFLRLFDARAVLFATVEPDAPHIFVWSVSRLPSGNAEARLQRFEPTAATRYLFDAPRLWRAHATRDGVAVQTMSDDGLALKKSDLVVPEGFFVVHPCTSLLSVGFRLAGTGEGRAFVLDSARPASARSLQFFATLVEHVAPAIHNVSLLRRLRSRAGAAERARVARELHDGAIQTLIGLEMEIHALRQGPARTTGLDAELAYIQDLVRSQVLDLRELMQQLRPLDLESIERLPDLLGAMVDKFRSDTGIAAHFVSTVERLAIAPREAVELARIVQEALANVRRHSSARNVLVRLQGDDGHWKLTIDDDGRGFDFAGRLTDAELDRRRLGPVVIRERARAIGAAVTIESTPGSGARLEIAAVGAVHA